MAEHLKHSPLLGALSDVAGDLADLVQKEIRLARVELSEKLTLKFRAGIWIGVAAGVGFLAVLVVLQGVIFGIASFGIALHWSCLIVAAALALIAAIAYAIGHAGAKEDLTPSRTLHQVKQDIATAKEQLS